MIGNKVWNRKGYHVIEVDFDGDLKEFEVVQSGEVIGTITPDSIESMQQIIEDLNAGEDVDGWDDGMGGVIIINKDEMEGVYEDLLEVVDEEQMSKDGYYLSFYDNIEDFKEQTDPESYKEILEEFNVELNEVDGSFITLDSSGSVGGFIYTDPASAFDDIMYLMETESKYKKYLK